MASALRDAFTEKVIGGYLGIWGKSIAFAWFFMSWLIICVYNLAHVTRSREKKIDGLGDDYLIDVYKHSPAWHSKLNVTEDNLQSM